MPGRKSIYETFLDLTLKGFVQCALCVGTEIAVHAVETGRGATWESTLPQFVGLVLGKGVGPGPTLAWPG
jgi:hypothetical protein